MFKVTNLATNESLSFDTKKRIADYISELGITDNTQNTIQKKINEALKSDGILYDNIKIEEELEMKEEKIMNNEKIEEVVEEIVEEVSENSETVKPVDVEKQEDKTEEKPNKRKNGKTVIAYKNGEEYQRFPSIKKCAEHFKELKGLGHMPFTPIMKSIRQNIDWEEYSFKFENEADLHIPKSLKLKLEKEQAQQKNNEETTNIAEETVEETVEEIVEEITEEIVEE